MQGNSSELFDHTPTKRCLGCKAVLPLTSFHLIRNPNGKKYPYSYCKPCGLKNRMKWHQTPKGQRAHRRRGLRKKYGISHADYEAMLASQDGLCAICRGVETAINRRGAVRLLAIDHDHATGRIRGLLCQSCNQGIARFKDDPDLLLAAIKYLQKPTQPHEG